MPFELHRAVEANNQELAGFLIRNGADVNEIETKNRVPLFYAIKKNNFELVKMLLDHNAKICINDYSYLFLALQISILQNLKKTDKDLKNINYQIVKLLIDKGANVNKFACNDLNIMVNSAIFSLYYPLVKLLLNQGANIEKYEPFLENTIKLIELDKKSENCIKIYNIAKLIITEVLSKYKPKEKPDFLGKNKILSDYWDEVKGKIDYLNEDPVLGKVQTQRVIKECEFLKNSLKGLSLNAFFKSNVKTINNDISNEAVETKSPAV